MIIHTEPEPFRHVKRHFMSQPRQLFDENAVKIHFMTPGGHDILKDSNFHGGPPRLIQLILT